MTTVPIIPESAPFSSEQRAWLNGFLAGILSQGQSAAPQAGLPATAAAKERPPLLIAFGSQSGNAETLAKQLVKEAAGRGFAARAAGLDSLQPAGLAAEKNVLIVTSTWGEGDMPDNAISFWEGLNQNGSSPKLDGVRYSVLALGDMNYGDTFCLAGRKLDQRLEELGASRIHPRVDCDVEFDELAKSWSEGVFKSLESGATAAATVAVVETAPAPAQEAASGYGKKNPFPAALLHNLALNHAESAKDTRHIAFSLAGSGLAYETGDALGVFSENCPEVVAAVIAAHELDPETLVPLPDGGEAALKVALQKAYEVRQLVGVPAVKPASAAEFVDKLRKLQPRLYSIASSLKAHPEEVHLCVGAVRYEKDGTAHKGVASTFLADRLPTGETTGVFVHTAKHFRVPADATKPMIMVGPGTGIAPFRAFLEEREAAGASGKNWLFFGDQRAATDFLYRDQIEAWQQSGFLTRLDLAFSRDQAEKIYVQTRMLQSAAELWKWLEEGAHFYVCGDASRMAKDVDAALHTIIQQEGGKTADEAAAYVADLKKTKRYARDVY
ncbi:MAG: sulfite reductase flavoprotein subunit alpha [Verrucomicrobium sp.]|nr:flavodoxin domain-containing protein [Verrucomicrobium sp.]